MLGALLPIASTALSGLGLLQSAKRGAKADRLQGRALQMAERDYQDREPFRDRARRMLMTSQPQLPGYERVDPGQPIDYAPVQSEIEGARIPGLSDASVDTRRMALTAADKLSSGPGRMDIANMRFQNLLDRAGETRKLGVEQIGQDAARLGRIGMGGVSTDLGNLEERIQTGITRAGRDLAAEAASGEISDRFNRLGALGGLAGQFRSEDINEGATRANLGLRRGGALMDLGSRRFGEQSALRDEERTERGTERDFAQQSYLNRMGYIDRLSNLGYRPPPTSEFLSAAGQNRQQASQGAAGAGGLLGQILQRLPMGGGSKTIPSKTLLP